jgi:2,3-bisphosphoglycerate-dependent phosphoglycerate mutase
MVRHGEADYASQRMTATPRGHQYDPPLSDLGKEQADLLTERLLLMDQPSAVYCSPLRRARETLAPFVERSGIVPAYDDDLMEAHIGEWEGKPFEEILREDRDLLERFRNRSAIWSLAPGVEDEEAFRTRVWDSMEKILRDNTDGNILVVAHGGVINAYCGQVLGLPQEMFFLPDNTSLNIIEVEGDARRVRFLNDVSHLTSPHLFREG